jgi:hypothetical protein
LNLARGIRVILSPALAPDRAIRVCEGVRPADGSRRGDSEYAQGAFMPVGQWREPSQAELKVLLSLQDRSTAPDRTVAVFPVDDHVFAASRSSYAGMEHLTTYARRYLASGAALQVHGIALKEPGLTTVTSDPSTGLRIGLHLDSWDKLPLDRRGNATSRLCINLGLEQRLLVFVNLTVGQLIDCLSRLGSHPRTGPELVRAFFDRFPRYPITAVAVPPRFAYMAPTENMLHDGSTLDQSSADVTATFRGAFLLPA